MVTAYPNIKSYLAEDAREINQLDEVRTSWVAAYRREHAEADWWAEGFGAVEHSLETQERVFRMAEQLAGRGIDRLAVFAALRHADAVPQANSGSLHEGAALQTQHLYVHGRAIRNDDYCREPWCSSLAAATPGRPRDHSPRPGTAARPPACHGFRPDHLRWRRSRRFRVGHLRARGAGGGCCNSTKVRLPPWRQADPPRRRRRKRLTWLDECGMAPCDQSGAG